MAKVQDTWYRISAPGKKDQVVKAGAAALQEAQKDRSPGRPKVVKVISPGPHPQAHIDAAGLPDSAWTSAKPKAKPKKKKKAAEKGADKAQKQGADKAATTEDE